MSKVSERDRQQFEDRIRRLDREEAFAIKLYNDPERAREIVLERVRLRETFGQSSRRPA